jgi:hypothetical protein
MGLALSSLALASRQYLNKAAYARSVEMLNAVSLSYEPSRLGNVARCGPTTETSLLHLGGLQVDSLGCAGVDADVLGDLLMVLREIESEISVV